MLTQSHIADIGLIFSTVPLLNFLLWKNILISGYFLEISDSFSADLLVKWSLIITISSMKSCFSFIPHTFSTQCTVVFSSLKDGIIKEAVEL
jgi:hypothetical protein